MARIAALYRYPVKGLTPEPRSSLTVLPEGRIAGDRVLGFRFADTPEADSAWSSKHGMLALINTPGLARLSVHFDGEASRLRLDLDGRLLAEDGLDEAGRRRLCAAMAEFALNLPDNPLDGHPKRLPLRLVGDGRAPRYHDSQSGGVSLHGRGSLLSLAEALGEPDVNERRFRSNIAVEGIDAWEEQSWAGRTLRAGSSVFTVSRPMVRCLATHANPDSGTRDLPVLTTLTRAFAQEKPTFAIALAVVEAGEISVGDELIVED